MHRPRPLFPLFLMILSVSAARVGADSVAEIRLAHTRWQLLPNNVKMVYVGADQRIWYRTGRDVSPSANRESARAEITREYSRKSPVLTSVVPVLFEPGGRVWFTADWGQLLIGYDGKEWTEQTGKFVGGCPNHGSRYRRVNLYAAGTAFFLDAGGVRSFDGKTWSFQEMKPPAERRGVTPRLTTEPGGRGVMAFIPGEDTLWRWSEGRWTSIKTNCKIWEVTSWMHGLIVATDTGPKLVGTGDETVTDLHNLGDYTFDKSDLLYVDIQGRAYFAPTNVDGPAGKCKGGLLICGPSGNIKWLAGEELTKGWRSYFDEDSGPILTADGNAVWLAGDKRETGPRLLSLTEGKFIDSSPEANFGWLQAVASDGTLFVSLREAGQPEAFVGAYAPGAPDDRRFLEGRTVELAPESRGSFCVDSKGRVWAQFDSHVQRFDGKDWHPVDTLPEDERSAVTCLIAGQGGDVLVGYSSGRYAYVTETGTRDSTDLKDLIQRSRKEIPGALFGGTVYGPQVAVIPDRSGNVWLLSEHQLSVLIGDEWVSAKQALLDAGCRVAEPEFALAAGGDSVYISDVKLPHDGGRSFWGRIEGGRIVLRRAPHVIERYHLSLNVVDAQGVMWLPGHVLYSGGAFDGSGGQLAIRTREAAELRRVANKGWAKLCDQNGNVWLGALPGDPSTFNIWRAGSVMSSISVPTAGEHSTLIADAPGSVYVLTAAGMSHLAAIEKAATRFKLDASYGFLDTRGRITGAFYSRLGYIVFCSSVDYSGQYRLHIVPLPKSDASRKQ